MLCRRAIQPQQGLWNLPAGFLENNEKPEDGAARETSCGDRRLVGRTAPDGDRGRRESGGVRGPR